MKSIWHFSDSNTWNDLEHKDDISVARSAVLGAHKKAAADRPVAAWNHKRSVSEEFINLDESVKTTHEDPLVTVHDKHGLHTHANLSTANHIFGTSVKHTDVHAGPFKTKDGHETKRDLTFAISKHHKWFNKGIDYVGCSLRIYCGINCWGKSIKRLW